MIYVGISLRCNDTLHHKFMFMFLVRININWLWGNWNVKKKYLVKVIVFKYIKSNNNSAATYSQCLLSNLAWEHQSWDVHNTSLVQLSLFWTVLYQCSDLLVACMLYILAQRALKSQLKKSIILTIPQITVINSNSPSSTCTETWTPYICFYLTT